MLANQPSPGANLATPITWAGYLEGKIISVLQSSLLQNSDNLQQGFKETVAVRGLAQSLGCTGTLLLSECHTAAQLPLQMGHSHLHIKSSTEAGSILHFESPVPNMEECALNMC